MGNSSATLVVRTTEGTYTAGSSISGRVYLEVKSAVPSAESLQISFTGKEYSVVHRTEHESHHHHHHRRRHDHRCRGNGGFHHGVGTRDLITHHHRRERYERSQRNIVHLTVPLASFNDGRTGGLAGVQPGQYEFPFEATLPDGLPGTMACHLGESSCEIRYELRAFLRAKDGGFLSSLTGGGGGFSSEGQPVRVLSRPPTDADVGGRISAGPETSRVNFLCCFNRGSVTVAAEADRRAVSPGSAVDVSFGCQNHSSVDILGADVQLEEVVSWSSRSRSKDVTQAVARQHLPPEALRGVEQRKKRGGDSHGLVAEETARSGYEHLVNVPDEDVNRVRLVTSTDARDTYEGVLIRVRHRIVVRLRTPFCVTNPETDMAVSVVRPLGTTAPEEIPEAVAVAVRLPDGWSPQTADLVSLPVADAVWGGEEMDHQDVAPSAPPLEGKGTNSIYDTGSIYDARPPATSPEYS